MRKACTRCGKPTTQGNRCEAHSGNHTGWSPNRDRVAQHNFRIMLQARAGNQCEHTTPTGQRCTTTTDLRACHLTPISEGGGYGMADGVLLCRMHDKQTDPYAR